MNAMYKGVDSWEGGWVNNALRHGDQVVCTVGQTDSHSSPDNTTSHTDVQWDRIGPQATLLMPLKDLTGSIIVLRDFTGSTTSHL